ncbi:metallophosphoesterase [Rheinheimera maricola]|uniref:Metallophosphoesterase n=1 Tax=Rheinheimera maricola TaxID=2793282 RepID=A0ABS7XCY1_9GAMM|nr:metallophosphoesterase [Rheinheimera maricola]MBZ9613405.1 metallophosphoesterase [Rheinheimera maricola]
MKIIVKLLICVLLLVITIATTILANATVELTQGGVYSKVYLPIAVGEIKWNAAGSISASRPMLNGLQGPVVTNTGEALQLKAWCQDKIITETLPLQATELQLNCHGQHYRYPLQTQPFTINADLPQAERIAVISDLEGNIAFFEQWARKAGVTDANGNWQFGNGQVVILGDAVDRGRQVFDLLWRLYALAQQAQQHGGQLLLLHGNHEQYVMRGLVDRVETEHFWAIEQLMPYEQSFTANTVLGSWLRQQPIIARIGGYLFTHGGISANTLASGLNLQQLNQRYYATLPQPADAISDADYQLFYGPTGLSQYRALLSDDSQQQQANEQHLQQLLAYFAADTLVIGHTPALKPEKKYAGKLIVVEAEHSDTALLISSGEAHFIALDMVKTRFKETAPHYRAFNLFSAADWQALAANQAHLSELNRAKAFFNRATKPE